MEVGVFVAVHIEVYFFGKIEESLFERIEDKSQDYYYEFKDR